MMTSEPIVVVVDDDRLQCRTVSAQIAGTGVIKAFDNPIEALSFVRGTKVDAAIVDMRMPACEIDGKQFLRELRKFDRDVAVIVRTADESDEIADVAIDSRAIKRMIKSRATTKETRSAVLEAIAETRMRRGVTSAASNADCLKDRLLTTLGTLDDQVGVGEMCRGMVSSMSNSLVAVSGYCDMIAVHASGVDRPELLALCQKNRAVVARMVEQLAEFLDNPFVQGKAGVVGTATANQTITALSERFRVSPLLANRNLTFSATPLLEDVSLSANSGRLLTALRHLIEYVAQNAASGTAIKLIAAPTAKAASHIAVSASGQIVFNRANAKDGPWSVIFTLSADMPQAIAEIKDALHLPCSDPLHGNLLMVSTNITSERCALAIYRTKTGVVFDLVVGGK